MFPSWTRAVSLAAPSISIDFGRPICYAAVVPTPRQPDLRPDELTLRDVNSRLVALARAGDYAELLARYARYPTKPLETGAILTMLANNYVVRVAEIWRLYHGAEVLTQGTGEGTSSARSGARECLRMLADEDTKLTRVLIAFGIIIPKTMQLHGKAKDTIDALRDIKREMDADRAPGPPRPRGRPRKLLTPPPTDEPANGDPIAPPVRRVGRPPLSLQPLRLPSR